MIAGMAAPQPAPRRRVLVAVSAEGRGRIARVLDDWDIEATENIGDLLRGLREEKHDVVIVGAHFDDSNAIGALKEALSRPGRAPVVCVRGKPFSKGLGQATLDALRLAAEALGAEEFIDLDAFPDDAAGNARVRRMFERLLGWK